MSLTTLNIYLLHLKNAIENNDQQRIQKYKNKIKKYNQTISNISGGGVINDLYKYYYDDRKYNLYSHENIHIFIKNIINWTIERLIGVKYKLVYYDNKMLTWKNTEALHSNHNKFPNYSYIFKTGTNCIGLINLIRLRIGQFAPISTDPYDDILINGCLSIWHDKLMELRMAYGIQNYINRVGNYPTYSIGTLLYREPKGTDPGHVAIYIGNNKILHSYPYNFKEETDSLLDPGVMIDDLSKIEEEWKYKDDKLYFNYYVALNDWLFMRF